MSKIHSGQIDLFCEENNLKGDSRKYLFKMPYELVRKYAMADVELPLQIFEKQLKIMEEEELLTVYDIERRLISLLLQMRKAGVRVDDKKIKTKINFLENEIEKNQTELNKFFGRNINVKSPLDIKEICKKLNIEYELKEPTEKMKEAEKEGNPKLDKIFLKTIDNPIIKKILK